MHNYDVSQDIIKAALLGDGVVYELEHRFAHLLHNRFRCLSVMNATSGLAAVLRCLPPGVIIAPLFTSPATWAAVEQAGHEVVFCDVDPVSVCLSPQAVSRHIETTRPQEKHAVRAIVTVNIFGHMSDLMNLSHFAQQLGAVLIVDAAQSLATCLSNPAHLSPADVVAFSLGPNKWLSCADGGMIAVKSPDLWADLVRSTQPIQRQMLDVPHKKVNPTHYNYRINPFTAHYALAGLQDIKQRCARYQAEQSAIIAELAGCEAIEPVPNNSHLVFEPLTAIALKRLDGYCLGDLPLAAPSSLADELALPETVRQLCHRKVIRRQPPVKPIVQED